MSFSVRIRFLSLLLAWGVATAVATDEGPPIPRQVLDDLTAANEARARRLREEDEWSQEKQRIELLRSTVQRETRRVGNATDAASKVIQQLEEDGRARQDERRKIEALRSLLARLTERVHRELSAIEKTCPPGIIPKVQPQTSATPEVRFLAVTDLLAQAKRQATRAGVEIVSGTLARKPTTVRLLRIGGVAAWWCSLDGKRAGRATVSAGELQLRTVTADEAASIRSAFDMAQGRVAPGWVVLHVEREAGQ